MKKWIALLLSLMMVLSLCSCKNEDPSDDDTSSSGSSYSSASDEDELTDDEIESIVVNALYNEINSKFDTADAGSSRYDINKTETKSGYVYVYGSVTLYDKYGMTTSGWIDESGTPYKNYTVKIDADTGRATSCEIE